MIAGLLLAVGCTLAGSVGMLLKQRGAVAAPAVLVRHPCAAQSTYLAPSGGFGFRLERPQWTGLLVTAVGLAVLALTQAQ